MTDAPIERLPAKDTIADELAAKIINAKFGTKACGTLMTEPLSNGKGYIVAEYDRDEEMRYHEGVLHRGKRWGERNSAQAIATLTAELQELRLELITNTGETQTALERNAALTDENERLREAAKGILPYVLSEYIECKGYKCRHPTCGSCYGEGYADEQSIKANKAWQTLEAALKGQS